MWIVHKTAQKSSCELSIDFPFRSVIIKGEKRIKPGGRQSETSLEWETDAERWGAGERLSQKLTGNKKAVGRDLGKTTHVAPMRQ